MSAALRVISRKPGPRSERPLESGIQEIVRGPDDTGVHDRLLRVQDQFIENWARMAGAFAMDRTMGRVHALVFIAAEPVGTEDIARRLGLPEAACSAHVDQLLRYGVIRIHDRVENGTPRFVAEHDGWTWFLQTLRHRRKNELQPIQDAVRSVRDLANELARTGGSQSAALRVTAERIERFTKFFDELSKLLDGLVTLGAGPVVKVVKTVARLMPRTR